MTSSDVTVSDTPPGCEPGGHWLPLTEWGYSRYEVWSRGGQGRDQQPVRSVDRIVNGRQYGGLLKPGEGSRARPGSQPRAKGYLRVKVYTDEGKPKPVEVHALILLANVGPPEPGMQTRHLDSDPWNNRWEPGNEDETRKAGGNLRYGTGPEQHADQVKAGTATQPTFPCPHHVTCGGTAPFEGVLCEPCRTEAGIQATALLSAGVTLATVSRKLGYTSERRMYAVACQYGGYKGTIAQARAGRQRRRGLFGRFMRGGSETRADVELVAQFAETYADGPVWDAACRLLAGDSR